MIARVAGERIAIVDSASATASALAELLSINGLEAPGTTRGTAAEAGHLGHAAPTGRAVAATHQQLTTGDLGAFAAIAARMFGDGFPEVTAVEVPALLGWPTTGRRSERSTSGTR